MLKKWSSNTAVSARKLFWHTFGRDGIKEKIWVFEVNCVLSYCKVMKGKKKT